MAAKMDKEMMKKQHFWLLLIPLMIGLLLAWIGLFSGVQGATSELKKKNDDARNAIGNAKAQPKKVVDTYEVRKGELFDLRTKKWKEMWEAQSAVYTWPKSIGEENLERLKGKQFGDDITETAAREAFRDHYAKEYELIAKDVAPMQFAGGWRSVLRHMPQEQWLRVPEPEDVWLAMEDFWVQKDIVQALAKINTDSAKLYRVAPVPPAVDDPMSRSFSNRTWQLDLKVVEGKQGTKKLVGSITNLTPRLQPYGANNQLLFNVWFSDEENAKPFVFSVQGSSMAGSTKAQITEVVTKHTIFEGSVKEILRVEQIHDARTAPIKRLDQLKMGYLSAKHNNLELQMTSFSQKAVDEANGMGMDGGMGMAGMMGGMFGAPPGGMFGAPPGGMGGGPGAPGMVGAGNFGMGGGAAFMGGGFMGMAGGANVNDFTYNRLERRRYLSRTEQVRAMPIAAAIVVDQSYTQDVLTALANSILRVQIVQMHMSRFRGNLSYDGVPAGNFAGGMGFPMAPGGMLGGPWPMGFPPPPGGIRGFRAPPGGIMGGFPPPPGGMGGFPMPPGGIRGGFPAPPGGDDGAGFPGAGGAPRNSSEDLASGNLVELSVYGIASLYEKFKPPEAKKDNTGLPTGVVPMPMGMMGVPMGMMGVPPTMPPMGMGNPPMGMVPMGINGVPPMTPMMPPAIPPAGMMGTPPMPPPTPPVPPKG